MRRLDLVGTTLFFLSALTVMQVPLGRYLLFVGSALIAMLFLADLYLPPTAGPFGRESQADKSIIRITSGHKWPEKVVYDTSQPIIVPPPVSIAAETTAPAPSGKAREAFAKMATVAPATERTSVYPKRKLKRSPPVARMVAYREPSFNWSTGW